MTGFAMNLHYHKAGFSLDADFKTGNGLTVIFGPSGAGKTTILNLFAGMINANSGWASIKGVELFNSQDRLNMAMRERRLGYVPQDLLLFPHLNVESNLLYSAKAQKTAQFHHIVDMLDLRLLLNRYPSELSGGEGRRLAMGRALLSEPNALLLDEPMAGLDPIRRQRLLPFIERIQSEIDIPILYVSHYAEEAARLADFAIMVADGQTIAYGPAPKIFSNPSVEAHFGPFDLGGVVEGRCVSHDNGLALVDCGGTCFKISDRGFKEGTHLRLRILARDVALALEKPGPTSVQNIIPCRLKRIDTHGEHALIRLQTGRDETIELSAMVTQQSVKALDLHQGQSLFAMIKAVAVARGRHPIS